MFIYQVTCVVQPLSSNRQHSESNDCLEESREDYQNYHYG